MSDNGGTDYLLETRRMKRRTNSGELKTTARYHNSNIDHDNRIRLGSKTVLAVTRTALSRKLL